MEDFQVSKMWQIAHDAMLVTMLVIILAVEELPHPAANIGARKYRCPPPLHLQMMAMRAGGTAQMLPVFSAP